MRYLKPVVVASTMLVASLSAPAFANHMNYAATPESHALNNIASIADRNSPKSDVPGFNWEKRLTVGGLLNVDTVYSQRSWNFFATPDFEVPNFAANSVHASDIVVNNANVFLDAKINNVTTAHIGLAFTQRPGDQGSTLEADETYNIQVKSGIQSPDLSVDEAYLSFNDCSSPFYLQAGRKFTSFANYNPYPITYSLTQLLSQTDEEVLELGYMSNNGFHGSLYAFNGPFSGQVGASDSSRIRNYGVDLGYNAQYDNIDYNLGLGYVKDIRDASFVSQQLNFFVNADSRSAAGYAIHADMNNGPLVVKGDYVAAVRQIIAASPSNTRAWAYGLEAGYGFDSMGWGSVASVGYQRSGDSFFLGMPRSRVLADYTVEVSKNAKVTLEYTRSQDHKASVVDTSGYNATNNRSNTATLRIGVSL